MLPPLAIPGDEVVSLQARGARPRCTHATAIGGIHRARRAVGGALVALGAWAVSPEALAQGCAMCRTAVEGSNDPLARALSFSTLFLLAMPFAIVASVGGWIFFSMRADARPDGAAADPANEPARSGTDQGE